MGIVFFYVYTYVTESDRLYVYDYKEVMAVRIDERLSKEQKQQLEQMKSPKQEQLSTKDIEELMGMNRDRYTRRNGAVRRK
jgi:hypothetical protein